MTAFEEILSQQRSWATSRGLAVDSGGHVGSVRENLRAALSTTAQAAFDNGSGGELRDSLQRPAKMRSLHSSSALVVNVFDYWATARAPGLGKVLGVPGVRAVSFEAQFPTGLEGNPPNLDLALALDEGSTIGIESKFTEWLMPKSTKRLPFKDKYFPDGAKLWEKRGLPKCQGLAEDLQGSRAAFRHLDGPQLLKHALGLATQLGARFSLWYLYFAAAGPEAPVHEAEIGEFTSRVGSEVRLRVMTYQELFERLRGAPVDLVDTDYVEYLGGRYLG